jgi:hypothetical protein
MRLLGREKKSFE